MVQSAYCGVRILTLLSFCIMTVALRNEDEFDEQCRHGLYSRQEKFFEAMWNQRSLVELEECANRPEDDPPFVSWSTFARPAYNCVTLLVNLARAQL